MTNPRLEAWWRANRDELKPWVVPSRSATPLVLAGPIALAHALRAELPDYLRPRFALPPDLSDLVELLGGDTWRSLDEWDVLWDADVIVSNLALEVRVHDDRELIETAGPWVQFALSGDHHHFFIYCDDSAAHFGHVIEGDDDHPWLENGLLRGLGREPVDLRDALPLADWLDRWRAPPDDDDGAGE